MKSIRKILGGLFVLVGFIALLNLLHAQETAMPVQDGAVSLTDTNVDWNSMSDLEVELKAVESVPPMPPESLPSAGTFWSAQHAPGTAEEWPPLPTPLGMGAWALGDDGVYLLADLNHVYASPKLSKNATTTSSGGMVTMNADLNPNDGSTNDGSGGDYAPQFSPVDAYGTNLWLEITNLTNNTADFMVSNTIADVEYEVQSTTNLIGSQWNSEGFFFGSEITNWTPASAAATNYPNLFYRIRSWIDSDNVGIPDWWQLKYFGYVGINPNAPDPAGDGYTNIQKYRMGLNPNILTSPMVSNFIAVLSTNETNVILSWNSSPGTVQNYTLGRFDFDWDTYNYDFTSLGQVNSNAVSFVDSSDTNVINGDIYDTYYQIQAVYTNGSTPLASSWIESSPPAPQGLTVAYNTSTGAATINWQTAPGAVTGYTVLRQDDATAAFSAIATVSASQTSYTDNSYPGGYDVNYEIETDYAEGSSSTSEEENPRTTPEYTVPAFIVRGANGTLYLTVAGVTQNITAFRVYRTDNKASYYPISSYVYSGGGYAYTNSIYSLEETELFSSGVGNGYFDVPVTNFVNGVYQLTSSQAPPYGTFAFQIQALSADGMSGEIVDNSYATGDSGRADYNIPFYDGRTQIAQNINFLLRTAQTNTPFSMATILAGESYSYSGHNDYVYAGFHFCNNNNGSPLVLNEFQPFEENSYYENYCFASGNVNSSGNLMTGGYTGYGYTASDGAHWAYFTVKSTPPTTYYFNTYGLVTGSSPSMSAVLSSTTTQWLYFAAGSGAILDSFNTNYFIPSVNNIYGLPLISVKWPGLNTPPTFPTMSPGNAGANVYGDWFFQYDQPTLSSNSYYFARHYIDPLPGESDFSVTNATPPIILTSVGQPFNITAWAKQSLQNGYSGKFAYAEQYFDKAYLADTNGNATTNQTGILSEYGEFFPTQPGQIILTTKSDGALGTVGRCTVNVIGLNLDANHDGTMDLSFNGQDQTSPSKPYVFWCNNNFDRLHTVDFTDSEQDDLQSDGCIYTPDTPTPDCNYLDIGGNRIIPDTRDLEDYSRLWISGVTSNLLASLPSGSTVTLSWGDVGIPNSANPTIDLFQAADNDGGIGYLTNSTIAANQIDPAQSIYVGRISPGQSVQLNASNFVNDWTGNHFIWCGVANGSGKLTLSFADASGKVLGQASVFIQIMDIKQMYERWTVGDNPNNAPASTPQIAQDGLVSGETPFQYGPATTNTPYILFVHGWNMATWEKDRFAETAFKRLYWQGYQGRVGEFRWPTSYNFPFAEFQYQAYDLDNYDNSEFNAWQSGEGLLNLLTNLNAQCPGSVYLMAHSMGNVVAGEALRLAGSSQVVNTYIAMQGAVPAHCYDPTTTTRSLGAYDSGTPNRYANYYTNGATCYFNGTAGAGTYVNFFNTNDWALNINLWQLGQNTKPDFDYGYNSTDGFYRGILATTPLYFPGDTYEIFAYCDEARCYALGAQPNVGGKFSGNQIELDIPPYGFGNAHKYHSGEFRSDNAQRWQFWNQTLVQMKLK